MLKQTQNGKIKNLKIKFNIFVRVPSVICAGPQLHKMPISRTASMVVQDPRINTIKLFLPHMNCH